MRQSVEARGHTPSVPAVPPRSSRQPRAGFHTLPVRRFPPLSQEAGQVILRNALVDYAIDPMVGDQRLADAFVPLGDKRHYRLNVEGPFGSGWHEFCGLADGFFVMFSETEYLSPQADYIRSPDTLQIYVANSGDGEYVAADGEPLSFEAPTAAIIIEPSGQPAAQVTFAGHTRYIYIVIHRDALKTLYDGSEHELPAVLRAFLEGSLQRTVGHALPLGGALLRCLDELHSCPPEGRRRRLFLQSKVFEILCRTLDALESREGFGSAETTRLTERGVLKAQRLLAQNFVTPPSLEKLALQVGLSRSALCTGFRLVVGQSVFDYIHELRMQQALTLLNERDASITQIAYAVGYNRASSFSVAVQRHFGVTPTALRRRGALPKS